MSNSTIEVLNAVQNQEPCTVEEVTDHVQYSSGTVSEQLSELHHIGILARYKTENHSNTNTPPPYEYEFIRHVPFENMIDEYPVSRFYSLAEEAMGDPPEQEDIQEHLFEAQMALSDVIHYSNHEQAEGASRALRDVFNHLIFAYDNIENIKSERTNSDRRQSPEAGQEDGVTDVINEALNQWQPSGIAPERARAETRRVAQWLRVNGEPHTPGDLKSNCADHSVDKHEWWKNLIKPGLSVLVDAGLIEYRFVEQDYRWIGESD